MVTQGLSLSAGSWLLEVPEEVARVPSAKKQALEMIDRLPDKATWDDIKYEIYVRKKIARGIDAADAGKVISHEEVKKRFL